MARLIVCLALLSLPAWLTADDKNPPEGFMALFNGKDLTGWKVHAGKMDAWGVDNGVMYVQGGGGGWLITEKEFGDYEMRLEYKVPVNGNSGVAARAPLKGDPAYQGMEIQILDDYGPAYTKLNPAQYTGSIYGVVPPAKRVTKHAGEWNQMTITCKGRKVKVEINGTVVVDANLDDYTDKHAKAHPGLLRDKGHVGFQSHDGRVEFRNIYLKVLD
jgi:hypothetical protein